ncbi:hypothetical protein [Dyella silvatica]|uniref:hypothetical protein n=1 Tax=Dyella silvatica TaxID=2992128 RepID=UPI00225B33CA|nr:hypothetical protein [Dyella silvatica]
MSGRTDGPLQSIDDRLRLPPATDYFSWVNETLGMKIFRVFNFIKVAAALAGIASLVARDYFYAIYVRMGRPSATTMNPIEVNDHGTYVFITLQQSDRLSSLVWCYALGMVLAMAVDQLQRHKNWPLT